MAAGDRPNISNDLLAHQKLPFPNTLQNPTNLPLFSVALMHHEVSVCRQLELGLCFAGQTPARVRDLRDRRAGSFSLPHLICNWQADNISKHLNHPNAS